MPKTPAKSSTAAPSTLPKSLIAALPSAPEVLKLALQMGKLQHQIIKELEKAQKGGPVMLARAYVTLHRMCERVQGELNISDSGKLFGAVVQHWKTVEIPSTFEQAGVPHVALDEGFRVGVSSTFRASIKPDQKDKAYAFLRANGLGDLITSTVNASTLSAAVKREIEDNNRDFPEELFKVADVPTTSVTATK